MKSTLTLASARIISRLPSRAAWCSSVEPSELLAFGSRQPRAGSRLPLRACGFPARDVAERRRGCMRGRRSSPDHDHRSSPRRPPCDRRSDWGDGPHRDIARLSLGFRFHRRHLVELGHAPTINLSASSAATAARKNGCCRTGRCWACAWNGTGLGTAGSDRRRAPTESHEVQRRRLVQRSGRRREPSNANWSVVASRISTATCIEPSFTSSPVR